MASPEHPAATPSRPDAFTALRLKTDRTLAFTWGKWGGFYKVGAKGWGGRICIGWLAITYVRDEFASMLRAYLDRLEAEDAKS